MRRVLAPPLFPQQRRPWPRPALQNYATRTGQIMNIERAKVTNLDGSFNCGRFFRYDWTLWALQVGPWPACCVSSPATLCSG